MLRRHMLVPLGVLVVSVALACVACSSAPARSVANFCSHYKSDKASYISKYDSEASSIQSASSSQPLVGLLGAAGMSFQMLGSLTDMFADLDTVAPPGIEPQVAAIHDSLKNEESSVGGENPLSGSSVLGGLLSGLESSMETSGDWQQVGQYVEQNCHTN